MATRQTVPVRGPDTPQRHPPPLTHEERRRLIDQPLVFAIVPPKTHAGTLIDRDVPTSGKRRLPRATDSVSEAFGGLSDLEDLIANMEE